MESIAITGIVVIGIIILTVILINVPINQIKALGDFFKKFIPSIPFTEIVKLLKKK